MRTRPAQASGGDNGDSAGEDSGVQQSTTSESEVASTSSDEETTLQHRGKAKRPRKYFRPEGEAGAIEDAEETSSVEGLEESLSEENEDLPTSSKRRKQGDLLSGRSSLDIKKTDEDPYDEEEAAFRRAISLSMKDAGHSRRSSGSAAGQDSAATFDAEEAAMQQALAQSLAESTPGVGSGSSRQHVEEMQRGQSRAEKAPTEAPDGRKGRRRQSKPAFAAPSVEMVEEAFRMLDPTGAGIVNRYALQGVASKLLHKELDDDDIDAMMDFAEGVTQSDSVRQSEEQSGFINAESFKKLVAKLSSPANNTK